MRHVFLKHFVSGFINFRWIVFYSLLTLTLSCSAGENAVSTPGIGACPSFGERSSSTPEKYALLVGIGDYASQRDIRGDKDAKALRSLLVDSGVWGFKEENVCLLLNRFATVQNFDQAITEWLYPQIKNELDTVFVYFAGHGSQVGDLNGDEQEDDKDETYVFHESTRNPETQLIDDDFYQYLNRLSEKSDNVVVIVDSCHSGTAARLAGSYRYIESNPIGESPENDSSATVSVGEDEVLDSVIWMAAADDDHLALENQNGGAFTQSLIRVMSSSNSITYFQLIERSRLLVKQLSSQRPSLSGPSNKIVFGGGERAIQSFLQVSNVDQDQVNVQGVKLLEASIGDEFYVISSNVLPPGELHDSGLAEIRISSLDSVFGTASKIRDNEAGIQIQAGDTLIPISSRNSKLRISVANEVPENTKERIIEFLQSDSSFSIVEEGSEEDDFYIALSQMGKITLRDKWRNPRFLICESDTDCDFNLLLDRLKSFQFQKTLLNATGNAPDQLPDQESIKIELRPAPAEDQFATCASASFEAAAPGEIQYLPICRKTSGPGYDYFVYEVWAINNSTKSLKIYGFQLNSDGCVFGLQSDFTNQKIDPGSSIQIGKLGTAPPFNLEEHLIVFGQDTGFNVPSFKDFDSCEPSTRSTNKSNADSASSLLARGSIKPPAREQDSELLTVSSLTTVVSPNVKFSESLDGASIESTREYTIPQFDIRPYLPDDRDSTLFKILKTAHNLAEDSLSGDGIGYSQHDWTQASDYENLQIGIDCSRAIWFAYTRSMVPYTENLLQQASSSEFLTQQYVPTVSMVSEQSLLSNNFSRCDNSSLQLGDVLVYRRTDADAGHVVMVIDPEQRVAWGSHGWDGNGNTPNGVPDSGAEYQLIKHKRDWNAWDRPTMYLQACWRHHDFDSFDLADIGNSAINECSFDLGDCNEQN